MAKRRTPKQILAAEFKDHWVRSNAADGIEYDLEDLHDFLQGEIAELLVRLARRKRGARHGRWSTQAARMPASVVVRVAALAAVELAETGFYEAGVDLDKGLWRSVDLEAAPSRAKAAVARLKAAHLAAARREMALAAVAAERKAS